MQLVHESKGVGCKELSPEDIKALGSPLAMKILKLLAEYPQGLHASSIAKQLRQHEQKIYYHTRRLLKAGVISIHHTEDSRGGTAKVLILNAAAFALRLQEFEPLARVATYLPEHSAFLAPFIFEGRLNAKIVVGSPDPHGPEHARSKDANYAVDLGLFLGTFLIMRAAPAVVLDTELRDWNQNLIIIGGPVVNKTAERINLKSPAFYDKEIKAFVVHNKAYGQEETGVIAKFENPYARGKWILYIAGRRQSGTKAAVLALLTQFDLVCKQNVTVVEGVDRDSDGVVDGAKII